MTEQAQYMTLTDSEKLDLARLINEALPSMSGIIQLTTESGLLQVEVNVITLDEVNAKVGFRFIGELHPKRLLLILHTEWWQTMYVQDEKKELYLGYVGVPFTKEVGDEWYFAGCRYSGTESHTISIRVSEHPLVS